MKRTVLKSLAPLLAAFFFTSFASAAPKHPAPGKQADGSEVGQLWVGEKGITETVEEIMIRENRKPFGEPKSLFMKKEHELQPRRKANPFAIPGPQYPPLPGTVPSIIPDQNPLGKLGDGGPGMLLPQSVGVSYDGTNLSETNAAPPDSMAAVGPTQIMINCNGRVKVVDKLTGAVGPINTSMSSFFNSVRGGIGTSDGMVRFDWETQRWYALCITVSYPNRVLLAVSSGPTITNASSFTFFFFQQDTVSPAGDTGFLLDYPSMGVDHNSIITGGNIFSSSAFINSSFYVINKASVMGAGPIVVSAFRNQNNAATPGLLTPRGVDNDDPASTESWVACADAWVFSKITFKRITYPGGVPTASAAIGVNVNTTANPANVVCSGAATPLDAIDDRVYIAKIHKNRISGNRTMWLAHSTRVNSSGTGTSGGDRNGVRWYEFTPAATPVLVQSGTAFDPAASNPDSEWFGSVAMSGQGHMAAGFSIGGAARTPNIAVAGRLRTDTLGVTQARTIATTSTAVFNHTSFGNPRRWGDYSHTDVDPTDDQTMWTVQMYCQSANSYAVRIIQLLAPPPATVTSLAPNTIAQGATINITVNGSSSSGSEFYDTSAGFNRLQAAFSGTGLTVNSVTWTPPAGNTASTSFVINVTATGAAATGARNITVTNPDGQTSVLNSALTVTSGASNPVPTLTSISPNSANAGAASTLITCTGTNFINGSIVRWNGADLVTTFVSATQVTATIPAANLVNAGTFNVTVFNPTPGGGTTSAQTFTVNNPVPTLTSVSPNSATVGAGNTVITCTGTNFNSQSKVRWNGADLATTYVSATSLTATIPAANLTTAGTFNVTVFNPTPGGGTTGAQTFTVNNPVPTLTSISPNSANAGAGNTVITCTGTNFLSTSKVRWNGADLVTTYVSATSLTATIPAANLTTAGTFSVTVFNPTPGGGTSGAQTFSVTNPAPTLTTISPNSANLNSAATVITCTGSNFMSTSKVRWNGADLTTTYVSATSLTATIPAGNLTVAGVYNVTVFNPSPGGGTSAAKSFTVLNPVPTITTLAPSSASQNAAATTIFVQGTNYLTSSAVQWDGVKIATTYVNATTLTAVIPAAYLTIAGTHNVTVVNPAPGGGASNAKVFTVNPAAGSVSGQCILQDYIGSLSTYPVTFEIMSGTTVVETKVVTLVGASQYSFTTALRGNYTIRAKAKHWLKKLSAVVNITNPGITGLNFSLKNGDVDNTNAVDLGDFDKVAAAFGSSVGDGNYNIDADLNGDGTVDLGDFDILAGSFGSEGD